MHEFGHWLAARIHKLEHEIQAPDLGASPSLEHLGSNMARIQELCQILDRWEATTSKPQTAMEWERFSRELPVKLWATFHLGISEYMAQGSG
jgi:hypothetical protein